MRTQRLVVAMVLALTASAVWQPVARAEDARQDATAVATRPALAAAFAAAYRRYPALPAGTLEALAQVASRGAMLVPDAQDAHNHLPVPAGVMGLHQGRGGFADLVGEASALTGLKPALIVADPDANVLAAAALLDARLPPAVRNGQAGIEALVPALSDLSGILPPARGKSDAIASYARDSHAYDVLLTLDRGVDHGPIHIAARPIAFEQAFGPAQLRTLHAPFVRIDTRRGTLESLPLDPRSATLTGSGPVPASTDYGPALWVASPNYSSRSANPTHIVVHQMEGTYAGSISWHQNPASQVSAHYHIRNSDGQVTQMVRDANKAWHIGIHNNTTIGIEHEGYINQSGWWSSATYNASSALTRHLCSKWSIPCSAAYKGPAHSVVTVLSDSYRIKGHQHFTGQDHRDPGAYFDWARYYTLLNPGTGGGSTVLDSFETSEGHFDTAPTYSGSTVGIAATSTAERSTALAHGGSGSERLVLNDHTSSAAAWEVRLLSGSGDPAQNVRMAKPGGRLSFWVYVNISNLSVAASVDDSDGTERSVLRSIPVNTWTQVEYKLDDQAQWNAWNGGDGLIDGTTTLDAVWFFHPGSSGPVTVYLDDVQYRVQ